MRLMPKKHIRLDNSIIGLAPLVYKEWNLEKTIDDNIEMIQKKFKKCFEDIILCLDYLFLIGKIDFNTETGEINKI